MTRAVVMGGGFAGMCAAQVLSESYSEVVIVESTRFDPENIGTPQAVHLHVLLARGRLAVERIFPGLDQELASFGCQEIDWGLHTKWISRAGEFPRYRSGITTRSASRLLIESLMRKRIMANTRITVKDRFTIDALAGSEKIESIHTKDGRSVDGDFFVNAMGRRDPFSQDKAFEVSHLSIFYSSCMIRNFSLPDPLKQFYLQMRPDKIGLVMMPIENGLYLATLLSDKGPVARDHEEFLKAIQSLNQQVLPSTIEFASPVKNYRHDKGRRALPQTYENLVNIGDADCAFNPVYGQGMTIATLAALKLTEKRGLTRKIQRVHSIPWMIAKAEDAAFRHVAVNSFAIYVAQMAFALILKLAVHSKIVHQFFLEVLHMRRPLDRGFFATLFTRGAI